MIQIKDGKWAIKRKLTIQQEEMLFLTLEALGYTMDRVLRDPSSRERYPFVYVTGSLVARCALGMFDKKRRNTALGKGLKRYAWKGVMEALRKHIEKEVDNENNQI